jgi:hypothetical protein
MGVVADGVALAGFRLERETGVDRSSQPGRPGVKMMWENMRREPASLFTFSRAAAICSLVRN